MLYANVNDAKANLSKYLSMIEKDDETVIICRNNHPVAQVTKFAVPQKKQKITLDSVVTRYSPTAQYI